MNEIKYTTDGKKVIIVGKLNSQETIVQEIFIINGNEIPSGENFVVKSLHDAPAVSWKESELKRINEKYEAEKKSVDAELDGLRRKYKVVGDILRQKIKYIGQSIERISPTIFDNLADYICGDIKFIVYSQYTPKIVTLNEFHETDGEKLRLISFFGNDDGTFTYSIGRYCDFSGGTSHFIPCKTYEEAIDVVRVLFSKKDKYGDTDIKTANELGIALDLQKLKSYWENKYSQEKVAVERQEKEISERIKRISEIESELRNIKS